MRKDLYKGISILSHIVNPHEEEPEFDDFEVIDSKLQSVLDEIFSIDEKTGLPKGDIQYYLSADGNPTVKNWLELNLLSPRSVSSGTSLEGVTDDLISEMMKDSNESIEDYVARLDSIRNEAVDNANKTS